MVNLYAYMWVCVMLAVKRARRGGSFECIASNWSRLCVFCLKSLFRGSYVLFRLIAK
jgi:hypothetical protein